MTSSDKRITRVVTVRREGEWEVLATMQTRYFGVRVYKNCGGYARNARFKKKKEKGGREKGGVVKNKISLGGPPFLASLQPPGGHICICICRDCNKCTRYRPRLCKIVSI